MSSTTFPNGTTLTSSANSPDTLLLILQPLTAQMLGIDPTTDPNAYAKVRVSWQPVGQPAWSINEQICVMKAVEEEDDYNRIRDTILASAVSGSVEQIIGYTRVWRVTWNFYGPNCFDQGRLVRDAMFLDWTTLALALRKLYLVTDVGRVVYVPEEFQGQFFKRADLSMRLNAQVTDTIVVNAVTSAEVIGYTAAGEVFDIEVPST
jgi:hypothetical protein